MSPGRFIGFLFGLLLLAPTVALAQGPVCNSQTQGTVACFAPAQNLQSTDILSGMQATGPQRSPQSVRVTPAQIVAAGGGGGGGSLTITDGTHTVTPTSNLTVIGATVGGTTPNATLTVSGGGSGISTITDGTHTVTGATSLTVTGATVGGTSPAPTLTVPGGGGTGANPTATAGPTAVNGSATTFLRSDGAPAIQKGTDAQFGIVEGDGATITCVAGVCTAIGGSATSIVPGTTTIGGATAPCVIENTGTTVMGCTAETGTGSFVRATSPTLVTPALGTPASGVATNLTGTAAGLTAGTATVANGLKSATTTVSVSAATAPTNGQVLTATGGTAATWQTPGTGSVSVTSLTPNIVVAPSPITGTGTVSSTVPLNTQSGASYAILTGDNTQLVEMTNASATTMTIPVAGSAGFTSGWGASIMPTLAATTLTPASGTVCGLSSISIQPGQLLSIATGSGTNYDCALGLPATVPSGTIASGKNLGLDSSGKIVTATVSGGGSLTTTDGTHSVASTTTQTFGNGFIVGGSAGSATINTSVTDTSKTASYSVAAGDMANALNLAATTSTPALTLPTASSTIFAPGMTLAVAVTGTVNWTITNSTGLTLSTGFPTTLYPGMNGTIVANSDGTHLDWFGSPVGSTTVAGVYKVDGSTVTVSGGVLSSSGGGGGITCPTGFTVVNASCAWTQTASSSASLAWTGLTLNDYTLTCSGIVPSGTTPDLQFQYGQSSTPITANYNWSLVFASQADTTPHAAGSNTTLAAAVVVNGSTPTQGIASATIRITGLQQVTTHGITADLTVFSGTTTNTDVRSSGNYQGNTSAIDEVLVKYSTGNITSGKCTLVTNGF